MLEGGAATKAEFIRRAPGCRVIHLATHGFFLPPECARVADTLSAIHPLLRAGVALAGANTDAGTSGAGILTAAELATLDLSANNWLVLSACNTGVGESIAGEGVLGLRRAATIAGTRTLVMSLWPVEDRVTWEWMSNLYENKYLRHESTPDAVRHASLRLGARMRSRGLDPDPALWGAFIASGDWR